MTFEFFLKSVLSDCGAFNLIKSLLYFMIFIFEKNIFADAEPRYHLLTRDIKLTIFIKNCHVLMFLLYSLIKMKQ